MKDDIFTLTPPERVRRRKSNIRPIVRVLRIEPGKDRDHEGRAVGDDWVLATFGADADGACWYLTTDRVHASELGDIDGLGPAEMAMALSALINRRYRSGVERRMRERQQPDNGGAK